MHRVECKRKKKQALPSLVNSVVKVIISSSIEELAGLTVNEIARKLDVNRSFLSRKFKEHTNLLLREYIILEKLDRSKELLKGRPDLTIEEITELIGFSNPDYFRHYFKKFFCANPQYYRINSYK